MLLAPWEWAGLLWDETGLYMLVIMVSFAAGTSSFGMSGVNAHLLLARPGGSASCAMEAAALPWKRQRFWAGPLLHCLVHPAPQQSRGSFR